MTSPFRMTARERIMAALNLQPVDKIPFVPLIDTYTLVDMPEEIHSTGGGLQSYHDGIIAASRKLRCDLMVRHVPVLKPWDSYAPHLQQLGQFAPPVEVKVDFQGSELQEQLSCSKGTLTGVWKFTDKVGGIPHPIKRAVTSYEEMKIFHHLVDNLDHNPPDQQPEPFYKFEQAIGDDGIATTSISNSPLMFLIEMAWGLEKTYYFLQDYQAEVEEILDRLHASLKRTVESVAKSPAQVVIQYENTSSSLLSPAIFKKYCLPYLNEYADILKKAGKIYLVHMCGLLQAFVDDFKDARFSGIADITPEPTGNFPLDEAAKNLPGKIVLGGIDPLTFICTNQESVKSEISGLLERIKPYTGVLLGSADTTPRGTPPENFHLIRSLVDTLGAYG